MNTLDFLDWWTPFHSAMSIIGTCFGAWCVVALRLLGKKIGASVRGGTSTEHVPLRVR